MEINFFKRKKVKPILQDEYFECGLTCLAMCFKYHGLNLDLSDLRSKYSISKEGTTLYSIMEMAESEGFNADSYEAELNEIHQLQMPAILHWDLNHFVVLVKVKKNKIIIADPAIGLVEYSFAEASKHYTGYAAEITPKLDSFFDESKNYWDNKIKNKKLSLKHFIKNTDKFISSLIYTLSITLIIQLVSMLIPVFTQVIIDDFIVMKTSYNLIYFVLGGIGLIIFRFYADILKTWSINFIGYRWHSHFSSYFFKKLLNIPVTYFESRGSSDILSRFNGLKELKETLTDKIVEGIIDSLMVVITFIAMCFYSLKLASISIVFFLSYMLFRYFLFKKEKYANRKKILAQAKETSYFLETMRSIESVKIYGAQNQRYNGWKKHYLNATNHSIDISKLKMWYSSSEDLLNGLEQILLLALAALLVINSEMTLGMLFAFFAYKNIFSLQGKKLIDNISSLKLLSVYLERLSDIENTNEENNLFSKNNQQLLPIKGNIKLENIYFKHKGKEDYIFEDFSLEIKAGENVVITGDSGKGKTTLLKIIMGILPIESGRILIDGIDLNQMGLNHYRKYISAVTQKEHLMSESILNNITFFSKPIDMKRVIESSKTACIYDDIINMTMQYNTIASEMGGSVSGGQEQRILLARALYKQPAILFLDEATSFLDQKNEKVIVNNLKNLGITRISVAHRQESIDMADRNIKL